MTETPWAMTVTSAAGFAIPGRDDEPVVVIDVTIDTVTAPGDETVPTVVIEAFADDDADTNEDAPPVDETDALDDAVADPVDFAMPLTLIEIVAVTNVPPN